MLMTMATPLGMCSASTLKFPTLRRHLEGLRFSVSQSRPFQSVVPIKKSFWLPLKIEAREPTRKESPKVRNRRLRKKDAAQRVGEEVIKACIEQDITKVSIDRNGFGRGERMDAFQIAIRQHGFFP